LETVIELDELLRLDELNIWLLDDDGPKELKPKELLNWTSELDTIEDDEFATLATDESPHEQTSRKEITTGICIR